MRRNNWVDVVFDLLVWAVLIGVVLVMGAWALLAAPLPVARPKAPVPVRPDGDPTADDLRKVRWLSWCGARYPIRLETETSSGYVCEQAEGATPHDGARRFWAGSAALEGPYLHLTEGYYRDRTDDVPELLGGPVRVLLTIGWKGGRLVGEGWNGSPVELMR